MSAHRVPLIGCLLNWHWGRWLGSLAFQLSLADKSVHESKSERRCHRQKADLTLYHPTWAIHYIDPIHLITSWAAWLIFRMVSKHCFVYGLYILFSFSLFEWRISALETCWCRQLFPYTEVKNTCWLAVGCSLGCVFKHSFLAQTQPMKTQSAFDTASYLTSAWCVAAFRLISIMKTDIKHESVCL